MLKKQKAGDKCRSGQSAGAKAKSWYGKGVEDEIKGCFQNIDPVRSLF